MSGIAQLLPRQSYSYDGEGTGTEDPSTWGPNEDALAIWSEKSYLDGIFIGTAAFGAFVALFFVTLNLLWQRPRQSWRDWIWIGYITVLFIISNAGNGTQLKFTQMIWIDNRNFPGGPAVYFMAGSTDIMARSCNCIYTSLTWLQDGLLLYRFWIIFNKRIPVIILPALSFLGTVSLGCVLIYMFALPNSTMWSTNTFRIFTAYWSISIGFNIILTAAIVTRLMIMRAKIGKAVAGPYASISAMLIESASLYTLTGIAFLVAYGLNSPVQNLLLPLLANLQCIAPILIIMRVAQGQAWQADTAARINQSSMFSSTRGGSSGKRTGQTDTFATSYNGQKGTVSTRVETVTWQDGHSGDYELKSQAV